MIARRNEYSVIIVLILFSCAKSGFHKEVIEGEEITFGNYEKGQKEGKWIHMIESDTHRINYYNRGSLYRTDFFTYTSYDTNLETRTTRRYRTEHYLDSVKHGLTIHYYKGKINATSNYKNGELHGKGTGYDSLGNVVSEVQYSHDSIVDFKQYHPNGMLYASTTNPKNGIINFYDSLGELLNIVKYEEYHPVDTLK